MFSGKQTDDRATELQPTYEPMPVASSDYGPYDYATTRPGSDKGNMRLTGQTHKKLVDPDYLDLSSGAAGSPDYQ